MSMFCYQCQEAAGGVACTGKAGVCGVKDEVIHYQDMLVHIMKGISVYSTKARELGIENEELNEFVTKSLFKTITNANFSKEIFYQDIKKALRIRDDIRKAYLEAGGKLDENLHPTATWVPKDDEELNQKAEEICGRLDAPNEDVRSLRALSLYGLKGMAAYKDHAAALGFKDGGLDAFIQKALASYTNDEMTVDENIALVMETGKFSVDAMALLDKANTESYGNPEITEVNIGVRKNPAILISGHDLKDMEELLAQTDGTGVDVYTHSEMLPANYYPAFKKYDHFVGNYGNAWWKQKEEFEKFNGAIILTTNCLVPPKDSYKDRVFTTNNVGFDGVKHIADGPKGQAKDYSAVIEMAKKLPSPTEIETGTIVGGFAHDQVFQLADKVIDAVKTGAIKKFIVMGGCDGRQKGRSYYTDFAEALPQDSVILTAGCAKFRYNKLDLGDIGGIPRVLDAGQCNDSYSLALIALKLKEVFELEDINELPIVYNIAWYEQKAVTVLLALLYLGVKNIHLGPTLPAFITPNVLKVLVKNFNISPIGTVEGDIEKMITG
ncbi:MAG: hydroxylamine reductase [Candidatus Cloacimonetes bacterium]|nr:hydroxylamine reductase [Candidatus Cloacimonadota bacterium]